MRISDWSSDGCSSDLAPLGRKLALRPHGEPARPSPRYSRHAVGGGLQPRRRLALPGARLREPPQSVTGHAACAMRCGGRSARDRGKRERTRVEKGKSVSVRVDRGGRRFIKKKTKY